MMCRVDRLPFAPAGRLNSSGQRLQGIAFDDFIFQERGCSLGEQLPIGLQDLQDQCVLLINDPANLFIDDARGRFAVFATGFRRRAQEPRLLRGREINLPEARARWPSPRPWFCCPG